MGKKSINLINKKFTRLTVLEQIRQKNRIHWKCVCECGKTTIVRTDSLTNGNVKSCGCYRNEVIKKKLTIFNDTVNAKELFNNYKYRAKKQNKEFTLDFKTFYLLTSSNCYYCKSKPSNKYQHRGKIPYIYNGLDRIDNSNGYIFTNILPCCWICNEMKKHYSYNGFINQIKKIYSKMGLNNDV